MAQFADSPFDARLDFVATLSGRAIEASLAELRKRDELTLALRQGLREGVSIDDLSNASGLSPDEIMRRTEGELSVVSDLDELVGIA